MIWLFNTLTRRIESLSIANQEVSFYACGPTVYDYAHIGNLRAYIIEDTLRRLLEFEGFGVNHVMNVTDVGHLTSDGDEGEDKVELAAKKAGQSAEAITRFYEAAFFQDLETVNVILPKRIVRASEHIEDQIKLILKLERKGVSYKTNDGLYFDTTKFKNYGQLGRLDPAGQKQRARIEAKLGKRQPADFALWKFSKPEDRRLQEWDSPWGRGFPGWHIECSAMSMKYLGETIDIHAGGVDHISVHHTNEIAQSETATGKKFVRFWLHGQFLKIKEERMGKSEGNLIRLKEIEDRGVDPMAFRHYMLEHHYRSIVNFTFAGLSRAEKTLDSIRRLVQRPGVPLGDLRAKRQEILEAFRSDLDIPKALELLHRAGNRALWLEFDRILGLKLGAPSKIPEAVQIVVAERENARKEGDFEKADRLRSKIEKKGFSVEDTEHGPRVISS